MKPRLLDLFCGAGGCSVGYARAGFDVVGVDIEPHDDYPFELHVMDWAESRPMWDDFDVIHASPPCPRYSAGTARWGRDRVESHPDLIDPVRNALRSWGGVYVIENVPGAPMRGATLICAQSLGLVHISRHRNFLSNVFLMSAGCSCDSRGKVSIYGHSGEDRRAGATGVRRDGVTPRYRHHVTKEEARELLGVPWMSLREDISDAIPPAYTEHIGRQLIDYLEAVVA